jgi:hypothetical protein
VTDNLRTIALVEAVQTSSRTGKPTRISDVLAHRSVPGTQDADA